MVVVTIHLSGCITLTRFPNMPIRVFNGGIGGDTAYDMNKRLDGDIFSKNPMY